MHSIQQYTYKVYNIHIQQWGLNRMDYWPSHILYEQVKRAYKNRCILTLKISKIRQCWNENISSKRLTCRIWTKPFYRNPVFTAYSREIALTRCLIRILNVQIEHLISTNRIAWFHILTPRNLTLLFIWSELVKGITI